MGLDAKTVENLENELAKNTEILESTTSKFNIRILNIAYSASCGNGNITTYIEFTTMDGSTIKKPKTSTGLSFKINFYKDSRLLYSSSSYFDSDYIYNFSGYDTIHIFSNFNGLIEHSTSARIFVVAN